MRELKLDVLGRLREGFETRVIEGYRGLQLLWELGKRMNMRDQRGEEEVTFGVERKAFLRKITIIILVAVGIVVYQCAPSRLRLCCVGFRQKSR